MSVVPPHSSLLPLVILLLLPSIMMFDVMLSLSCFFFAVLFVAAAAIFALFIDFSQTQWHVSIDVVVLQSASSFFLSDPLFFHLVFFVVAFPSHACWKVTVNLFELLPAASFTCVSVVSLISLCCRM